MYITSVFNYYHSWLSSYLHEWIILGCHPQSQSIIFHHGQVANSFSIIACLRFNSWTCWSNRSTVDWSSFMAGPTITGEPTVVPTVAPTISAPGRHRSVTYCELIKTAWWFQPLKNISQIGTSSQLLGKIKKQFQTNNQKNIETLKLRLLLSGVLKHPGGWETEPTFCLFLAFIC